MKLILVRHGESVGNFENRLQGQADFDLTEKGRIQAELTAGRLAALGASAVYTSHLLRARNTAETIGRRLGVEPRLLPGVSEYDFGDMSGATYTEVRQHFTALATPALSPQERVYPGEEGRERFAQRVKQSLWDVIGRHASQTVAVVSHGGPIALFCQAVLGLPYKRPMPFAIANCSLAIIDVEHTEAPVPVLSVLNDTCHLRELDA